MTSRNAGCNILPTWTAIAAFTLLPLLNVPSVFAEENTNYRHGVMPMIGSPLYWERAVSNVSSNELRFGGGIEGVGVTTGRPKVYLVFWGSQWGAQGTDANGYATFSGDPAGMAPDLQAFFKGLGTSELWSGIMTQYCQGVAAGAVRCPATAAHVGYPAGGALAGVWEDTSKAAPGAASAGQLAQEAADAAAHFGNTTTASNRHAQYMIVSPTGTDPDDYKTHGFCAWHDWTGNYGVGGPALAFTNMPYITDVGGNCGAGAVTPGNNLDGVTIVGGHEYAETITDQFPTGGWTVQSGGAIGEEAADLCAWLTTGNGRMQNLVLTTGSFAVQGIWSNSANSGKGGCVIKHAIVK